MTPFTRVAAAILLAFSGLLFVGHSANAMPCDLPGAGCTGESNTGSAGGEAPNITCSTLLITPEQEEVIQLVTVPAVTKTLVEYVHRNENHPNSPRWEEEGWNADSNPNSVGWQSTGNTEVIIITPEYIEYVLISPAVPAVTEKVCITETVPSPETPAVPETPETSVEVEAAPAANVNEQAPTPSVPDALNTVAAVEQVEQTAAVSEDPKELAYTGFNWSIFTLGTLALALGVAAIRLARKTA